MTTISSAVREAVANSKLIQEGMSKSLLSYAAVAESMQPTITKQVGKEVDISAIVMALRRYADTLHKRERERALTFSSEIILKTGICFLAVPSSKGTLQTLVKFQQKLKEDRDTINIIHGNYTIAIITNERQLSTLKQLFPSARAVRDLVSISIMLNGKAASTPGVLFELTRALYWNNISIHELVTSDTEFTFIFQSKDAESAYRVLKELVT